MKINTNEIIYLDGNAWQKIDEKQISEFAKHVNSCNPNSLALNGEECRKKINELKGYIPLIAFKDILESYNNQYDIETIITQSGTQANVEVILGYVLFFMRGINENKQLNHECSKKECQLEFMHNQPYKIGQKHDKNKKIKIITTSIEHSSIEYLQSHILNTFSDKIEIQILCPDEMGQITLKQIDSYLTEETNIISIIHSSNETGIVNEIEKIANIAKQRNPNVFIHTDLVQSFSKVKLNFDNIDAVTIALQKVGGPTGISFIVKKKESGNFFLSHHSLSNQLGGTLNMGLIYAALAHCHDLFQYEDELQKKLQKIPEFLIQKLNENFQVILYSKLINASKQENKQDFQNCFNQNKCNVILYGHLNIEDINVKNDINLHNLQIPTTFLISFVKLTEQYDKNQHKLGTLSVVPYCRFLIRKQLEQFGVIVGLGSACLDVGENSVLRQMEVQEPLLLSAIRISFCVDLHQTFDHVKKQIERFVTILETIINDDSNLIARFNPE